MSPRRRADDGFTLIEMVIAMMVMGVAVVALVGALATMLQLSGQHRGQAVIETGAHSFSQAVMAAGQFQTSTSGVNSTSSTLPVSDPSLLKAGVHISVDRETMLVTGVGASSVSVTRGVGGTTATAHGTGAKVNRLLGCPMPSDLDPPTGTFARTPGVDAPRVTGVEYWDPATTAFISTQASSPSGTTFCRATYETICRSGEILAECEAGLYRATITVPSSGDSRLRGVTTTTTVLVRTGGA